MRIIERTVRKGIERDLPGGPVVKNPPSNAEDQGSIPGWGTKIPHASKQLSPYITTKEALTCRKEEPACHSEDMVQPEIKTFSKLQKNV